MIEKSGDNRKEKSLEYSIFNNHPKFLKQGRMSLIDFFIYTLFISASNWRPFSKKELNAAKVIKPNCRQNPPSNKATKYPAINREKL